jgi:hypothetical protein
MLEHARGGALRDTEYEQLKAAVGTLVYLTQLVEDKSTTIAGFVNCSSELPPRRPPRYCTR